MIIFDGNAQAHEKEATLKVKLADFVAKGGAQPTIAAILFREDTGSQLYTRLKSEAAERVGIVYLAHEFSLTDPVEKVIETIAILNSDARITGIIVQKPWRKVWLKANEKTEVEDYAKWWYTLMSAVDPVKDVDGLHPITLAAIKAGTWQKTGCVLPATCQAVLFALDTARSELAGSQLSKVMIIGRSDLVGLPLFYGLQQRGEEVELLGTKELAERKATGALLTDAQTIVSATGHKHLITGEMVRDGVIVVDVGEPQPDVEFVSVSQKASFITPVPGGIGPLTVSFLLENALQLAQRI